jgi:hypothetical protein
VCAALSAPEQDPCRDSADVLDRPTQDSNHQFAIVLTIAGGVISRFQMLEESFNLSSGARMAPNLDSGAVSMA